MLNNYIEKIIYSPRNVSSKLKPAIVNKVEEEEDEIVVIQDGWCSGEESDSPPQTERSLLRNPTSNSRRNYVPSPIGSPASARRITRKISDQISRHSPRLTLKKSKVINVQPHREMNPNPATLQEPLVSNPCPRCREEAMAAIPRSSSDPDSSTGPQSFSFLSLCASMLFPATTHRRKKKNYMFTYFTDHSLPAFHHFSDAGRIASRHHETKWDAWTTMGENVHDYESFNGSDEYSDSDNSNVNNSSGDNLSTSSSDSDNLIEIPFNNLSVNPMRKGKL